MDLISFYPKYSNPLSMKTPYFNKNDQFYLVQDKQYEQARVNMEYLTRGSPSFRDHKPDTDEKFNKVDDVTLNKSL